MNKIFAHDYFRLLLPVVLALCPLLAFANDIDIDQADTYRANGAYFKANSIYFRALSEGRYTEQSLYGLSDSFMKMNKPDEALKRVNQLLELNPRHAPGLWLRSLLYHNQGDLQASLSDLERLRQLEPDNTDAWLALENIYTLLGDQQNATAAKQRYKQLSEAR